MLKVERAYQEDGLQTLHFADEDTKRLQSQGTCPGSLGGWSLQSSMWTRPLSAMQSALLGISSNGLQQASIPGTMLNVLNPADLTSAFVLEKKNTEK